VGLISGGQLLWKGLPGEATSVQKPRIREQKPRCTVLVQTGEASLQSSIAPNQGSRLARPRGFVDCCGKLTVPEGNHHFLTAALYTFPCFCPPCSPPFLNVNIINIQTHKNSHALTR